MTRAQRHWDMRAALNFMLGGAGSGLLIALAFSKAPPAYPAALALTLIALGLGAVWLEIGRKLRAPHVLFNPFTSWMTREAFAALFVFPLALGTIFVPEGRFGAAIAAAAFLYCQARILKASKGIPAWRAPEIVPLIVAAGLAEGAALLLLFSREPLVVTLLGLALLARVLAWGRYRAAVTSEALEPAGKALVQIGTVVALPLVAASLYLPEIAPLATAAALGTGGWLKLSLVTRAAVPQQFVLPRMPVRGTR